MALPLKENMARQTKEEKAIEAAFHAAYRVHGNCVQIDIMDMGKLHSEAVATHKGGQSMDDAVKAAIAKYRKN